MPRKPAAGQPNNLKIKATAPISDKKSNNITIASSQTPNNRPGGISIATKQTTKFDQNRLGNRITIAGKTSNNKDGLSITGTSATIAGRVTKKSQQNIKVTGTNRKKPRSLLR